MHLTVCWSTMISDPNLDPAFESDLGRAPGCDDIKIINHPRSGMGTKYFAYDKYHSGPRNENVSHQSSTPFSSTAPSAPQAPTTKQAPWKPFRTRLDFEIAEFMQDAHLNQMHMSKMLALLDKIAKTPTEYTILNLADVQATWKIASDNHDLSVSGDYDSSLC
jgi:hypothetical protein